MNTNSNRLLRNWAKDAIHSAAHANAQEVIIVLIPDVANTNVAEFTQRNLDVDRAACASILVALSQSLAGVGMKSADSWLVIEDAFWEFNFISATFASQCRFVDPQVIVEVRDDFASAGWRHVGSRDEVLREFTADPCEQVKMMARISAQSTVIGLGQEEEHRDAIIHAIVEYLEKFHGDRSQTKEITPAVLSDDQAQLVIGLMDVRVRDCVLWQLTSQGQLAHCADVLRDVLRATPAGLRGPIATVAALAFWMRGDGVRATAAVAQAQHDDAKYGLAHLADIALVNGIAPDLWIQMMGKLPYDVCRAGTVPQVQ